jgi:hypothetical protein
MTNEEHISRVAKFIAQRPNQYAPIEFVQEGYIYIVPPHDKKNPKREGSQSAPLFTMYFNGISCAQHDMLMKSLSGKVDNIALAARSWDLRHGFIVIEPVPRPETLALKERISRYF